MSKFINRNPKTIPINVYPLNDELQKIWLMMYPVESIYIWSGLLKGAIFNLWRSHYDKFYNYTLQGELGQNISTHLRNVTWIIRLAHAKRVQTFRLCKQTLCNFFLPSSRFLICYIMQKIAFDLRWRNLPLRDKNTFIIIVFCFQHLCKIRNYA